MRRIVLVPTAVAAAIALTPAVATAAVRPAASPPASYDLSRYAVPPGEQGGEVNSCASWATGYTGYGLLMNEQGIAGGPMAPMYVYAQIVKGRNINTSITTNLQIQKDQGIDTRADYTQGDYDYTTQPTAAQRTTAGHYRISSYDIVPLDGNLKTTIETAVANGYAVVIGFRVRDSFTYVDAENPVYAPGDDGTDPIDGGHSVVVVGYDQNSFRFENAWGDDWGAAGFASASWDFVSSSDIDSVHVMHKLVSS
jgi:hypothetical protein